jgi:hypothetical protein
MSFSLSITAYTLEPRILQETFFVAKSFSPEYNASGTCLNLLILGCFLYKIIKTERVGENSNVEEDRAEKTEEPRTAPETTTTRKTYATPGVNSAWLKFNRFYLTLLDEESSNVEHDLKLRYFADLIHITKKVLDLDLPTKKIRNIYFTTLTVALHNNLQSYLDLEKK